RRAIEYKPAGRFETDERALHRLFHRSPDRPAERAGSGRGYRRAPKGRPPDRRGAGAEEECGMSAVSSEEAHLDRLWFSDPGLRDARRSFSRRSMVAAPHSIAATR